MQQNELMALYYCRTQAQQENTKASKLPDFLFRSGVLDDVETTGVNSASSGSSPVILILHSIFITKHSASDSTRSAISVKPVSYTHLTLPTKRIV